MGCITMKAPIRNENSLPGPILEPKWSSAKAMKLVLVGPYPVRPVKIANGVEAVVVYLLEGLRHIEELDIDVISCTKEVSSPRSVCLDKVKVHYLPSTQRFGNLTLDVVDKLRVFRKIKNLKPDVVHVHNHANYPYIISEPCCPTITTVHGLVFREVLYEKETLDSLRKFPRIWLERIVLRKARNIIGVTSYVKDMISPLTHAEIHIVENPVSKRYFHKTSDERPNSILFAGSIEKRKNLLGLLQALNILRNKLPSATLRIAGGVEESYYFRILRSFVSRNRLDSSVEFLGRVSDDKLLSEYARCSLVASCSYEETSGMVIQQAMAAGKASVVSRIGGFSCIVRDGETGFLVDLEDINSFASKMHLLLANKGLREKMGQEARLDALGRFEPEIVARKTYGLYKQLLRNAVWTDHGGVS